MAERAPTNFRLSHNLPNLLADVYERLALLVASRAPVAESPGFGRLFVPESGKQKYHSKQCSGATRYRRWKEVSAHLRMIGRVARVGGFR